jgi:hypothetical protein
MLSSVQQLALPLEKHRNHYLFSDYYLNTLLPRQPGWREADAQAAQALEALRQFYADKRDLLQSTLSESALEDAWVRPILGTMSHTYHVGASLPSPEGSRTPDYALFPDKDAYSAAIPHLGTAEFFGTALAVADAKRWDRSLDRRLTDGAGDAFSNANPSYQIDYYLRITGRNWGLLTNGRLWRLYSRESSFRLDSYYEVDLINLLEQGQVEDFKYFYLFFRRAAFPEFLNWVLRESREHAQAISERLKERIYEALRLLAEGFLKYPGTSLTPADLKEIHDNALILLYRLLFILYAESRRLLPLDNASYARGYSLKAVKEEIADRLDRKMIYLPRQATIWDNLKALFHIINEGSAELGVPAYNGRLFDPTKYPFLEEHTIGDACLVQALDGLARAKGPQGLDFVDYRDLEIRHLGSIYEGLLEYQLRHADQDMAVVKDGKVERVVPAEEGQKVVHPADSVYPVTERGERKATGSYYTPDYIVKYIVENTVGPLVDEKQRAIQDRLNDLEAKLKAARGENRKLLERELVRERDRFGETVLELQVLDPAMGSGHFLVEATDYLAQRIVDFGVRLGAGAEGAEGPDETEISYWRRRAVESCIYGVDVNPLAVELAKLSLWLATAAKGKPLSFLDHHLRCGNSLIGARLEDLGGLPVKKKGKPVPAEQMALFDESAFTRDVSLAVHGLAAIQALASDSVEDIHQKERIFQELLDVHLKRWRQIADLWASAYFGNEMAPKDYAELVRQVQTGESWLSDAQAQPYLYRANALWQDKRFFHWELEFPEVFFDQYGRRKEGAGFDAVVGNPPYDVLAEKERKEDLSSFMDFIDTDESLHPARGRKIDLFRLFVAKAISLVGLEGITGFIVPMSLLADQQTVALRKHLLTHHNFLRIDAFPQKDDPLQRVFPEAKLPTCVIVVRRSPQRQTPFLVTTHPGRSIADISGSYLCTEGDLTLLDKEGLTVPLLPSTDSLDLARKLYSDKRRSCLIGDLAPTYQGEINETTMTEFLSTDMSVGPLVLRGGNIQRYEFQPEAKQGEDKYLNVRKYEQEVGGDRVGHTNQPRIGYQRNAALDNWRRLIFTPLPTPCYCFDSVSSFLASDRKRAYALLALLNSRLLEWRFRLTSTNNHVSTHEIASLPAIRFAAAPSSQQTRMVEAGKALANKWVTARGTAEGSLLAYPYTSFLADPVGGWLAARLDWSAEQSDVVHDLLAHLAEQMVALNQEKQAEVKGFLAWLEREIGVPIGSLNNRTTLQKYLGDYQKGEAHLPLEGPLDILRQNRARLKTDPTARAFQERLSQEYQASLDKLLPLKGRLAATDRLIDLIVYRLYGLTEDEVAVVEGSVEVRKPPEGSEP